MSEPTCEEAERLASQIMAGATGLDGRRIAATLSRHYARLCACEQASRLTPHNR